MIPKNLGTLALGGLNVWDARYLRTSLYRRRGKKAKMAHRRLSGGAKPASVGPRPQRPPLDVPLGRGGHALPLR